MESKELNIQLSQDQKELVIRTGDAEQLVPFRKSLNIKGTIDTVSTHLANAPAWLSEINKDEIDAPINFSYVEVNRSKRFIRFVEDAGAPWESHYEGILEFDPRFKKFSINTGVSWTTIELANFIKMNRSHFETRDKAMQLVSDLRNFKAKVDKEVENASDDRGNRKILVAQAVESNIPESFKILVPVFKSEKPTALEIEIAINSQDLSCSLISPEVNDYIEDTTDQLLDVEIDQIKNLFPELRIFEV